MLRVFIFNKNSQYIPQHSSNTYTKAVAYYAIAQTLVIYMDLYGISSILTKIGTLSLLAADPLTSLAKKQP